MSTLVVGRSALSYKTRYGLQRDDFDFDPFARNVPGGWGSNSSHRGSNETNRPKRKIETRIGYDMDEPPISRPLPASLVGPQLGKADPVQRPVASSLTGAL